jgi:hypothetical protein
MSVHTARFTVLLIVALLTVGTPAGAAAQATPGALTDGRSGSVRGTTMDRSSGVLPGVTVTAVVDGRTLDTTVTDGAGEFKFDRLPVGPVSLSFHLDGFEDARASVTVLPSGPGSEARLVQRLELPTRTESVVVRGDPPPPPPPPRPVLAPVPDHDQASVCGPAKADFVVPMLGTIRSRRDETTQGLFAAGDELLIDGGTLTGLAVGQNVVVRRRYPTEETTGKAIPVFGEHSSGLLQVVSVDDQEATAVVVYACDEMMTGDYLALFEPEPVRMPDPVGKPAFDRAARILFADAGQMLGVPRRMMVIDRGTRDGVQPGQRFTLFRRSRFGRSTPAIVGEAVVVAVRTDSATIRVEQATDVIFFGHDGDLAAPQGPPLRASQ